MRKPRSDSTAEIEKAYGNFGKRAFILKKVKLTKKQKPFFESALKEIPSSEITAHVVDIVVHLARTMCHLENEQYLLDKEGCIVTVKLKDGTRRARANPRVQIVGALLNNVLSLRRSLGITARALSGEARDVKKRWAMAIQNENADVDDEDGLLARPKSLDIN